MPVTRSRWVSLLPTVLVALCAWVATTGTAQAHTGLRGSSPAEGSTTTEPITAVTLTFSGAVRGPEVTVTGPEDGKVSTTTATADGSTVTVPVALTAVGAHTVSWAVTSEDGHRLEGTVAFRYSGPVAAAPTSAAATTADPTPAAPTTENPATSPEGVRPSEAAATTDGDDGSGTATVVAVAVVLLAVGGGGGLLTLRRGHRS